MHVHLEWVWLGSGMVPTSGGGVLGLPPIMRGGKYKVLGVVGLFLTLGVMQGWAGLGQNCTSDPK